MPGQEDTPEKQLWQMVAFIQSSRKGQPSEPVDGDFVHGIYFKPTHGEMIHAGSLRG